MKKLLLLLLLIPASAWAQINVTAVVQDAAGNLYTNGFGSASLYVPPNATTQPLYNGSVFQTQIPFNMDSFGNLGGPGGINLLDNNIITDGLTPSGTQWVFHICMKTQAPYYGLPCFNLQMTITGSSPQNITSQIQGAAALLPGAGSVVSINGTSLKAPNFNNTTPAAQTGFELAQFQWSGSNVSVEVPLSGLGNGTTVIDATTMSGADFGAKVNAAITAGANVVDARGFIGTQSYSEDINPTGAAVTIFWPEQTINTPTCNTLLYGDGVFYVGQGKTKTVFTGTCPLQFLVAKTAGASGPAVYMQDFGVINYGVAGGEFDFSNANLSVGVRLQAQGSYGIVLGGPAGAYYNTFYDCDFSGSVRALSLLHDANSNKFYGGQYGTADSGTAAWIDIGAFQNSFHAPNMETESIAFLDWGQATSIHDAYLQANGYNTFSWVPNHVYHVGEVITDSNSHLQLAYAAAACPGGISSTTPFCSFTSGGGSAPTWATVNGAFTADNGGTWEAFTTEPDIVKQSGNHNEIVDGGSSYGFNIIDLSWDQNSYNSTTPYQQFPNVTMGQQLSLSSQAIGGARFGNMILAAPVLTALASGAQTYSYAAVCHLPDGSVSAVSPFATISSVAVPSGGTPSVQIALPAAGSFDDATGAYPTTRYCTWDVIGRNSGGGSSTGYTIATGVFWGSGSGSPNLGGIVYDAGQTPQAYVAPTRDSTADVRIGGPSDSSPTANLYLNTAVMNCSSALSGCAIVPNEQSGNSVAQFSIIPQGTGNASYFSMSYNSDGAAAHTFRCNVLSTGISCGLISGGSSYPTTWNGPFTVENGGYVPSGATWEIQSGGTLQCDPGSTCPSGSGTVTVSGSPAQYDAAYWTSGTNLTKITAPAVNRDYYMGYHVTGSAASAPFDVALATSTTNSVGLTITPTYSSSVMKFEITGTYSGSPCPTCAVGPGSSTANHLVKFSGTDGLTLADAGAIPSTSVTVNGQACTLGSTCNLTGLPNTASVGGIVGAYVNTGSASTALTWFSSGNSSVFFAFPFDVWLSNLTATTPAVTSSNAGAVTQVGLTDYSGGSGTTPTPDWYNFTIAGLLSAGAQQASTNIPRFVPAFQYTGITSYGLTGAARPTIFYVTANMIGTTSGVLGVGLNKNTVAGDSGGTSPVYTAPGQPATPSATETLMYMPVPAVAAWGPLVVCTAGAQPAGYTLTVTVRTGNGGSLSNSSLVVTVPASAAQGCFIDANPAHYPATTAGQILTFALENSGASTTNSAQLATIAIGHTPPTGGTSIIPFGTSGATFLNNQFVGPFVLSQNSVEINVSAGMPRAATAVQFYGWCNSAPVTNTAHFTLRQNASSPGGGLALAYTTSTTGLQSDTSDSISYSNKDLFDMIYGQSSGTPAACSGFSIVVN